MSNVESNVDQITSNKKLTPKIFVESLLQSVDITINGSKPWDMQIYNEDLYQHVLDGGALALGESYMDKWWDCQQLDVFFEKILRAKFDQQANIPLGFKLKRALAKVINFQTRKLSKVVAHKHYNLGNTLFTNMLDERMIYSCGYWKDATTLDDAQHAKLDLICQKLQLKPGQRLLDIGCGWGGLAKFAAEKYGVSVVGVTISQPQYEYAREYCKDLAIDIRLQDYRDINEKFDHVVSVGMFEHVGHLNYRTFMNTVYQALKDDGLFLLHTIGSNQTYLFANEWITTYIFPNGMLPSIQLVGKATEKLFVMEDWHNFSAFYDHTLMAWHKNFIQNWDAVKKDYDDRFFRMWQYYLLSCAGGFRARLNQLWQIVFSKQGMKGGYYAPR